ncbi:MAG TPA: NUDIX domain-containing protein [Patescibacteria group bacterium]|nr:NUDIX domain-containing protein [Patescibacteria group bacterium]
MSQFATEYWPETYSRVEFFTATVPPALPVSAVKVYVFRGNDLLLANIASRGWDLPGGHIEANETPEQALTRELKEETGASIESSKLIGYLKITNEQENERNKKYHKESCILVYKGYGVAVDANHSFQLEASESNFVSLKELPSVHHGWNEAKAQVVAYAFDYQ